MSWFSSLKHSWRMALQFDRSQVTAVQAIRSTVGFVLPLAVGVATGHVVEGVSMAGGAVSLGSVGLAYTYRARTRTMLLACAGVAISAFVGSITGRIDWLAILVAGIWGIGAGLLVSISQPAMVVGLQSAVALIILSHFALDPLHAAIQAALMFAGALLQTALAIIPSPWQRTAPERTTLSVAYQKLADYAVDPSDEQKGQQVRDALLKSQSTLLESSIQSPQGMVFFGLLAEAEHIRLSLIVLTRLQQNLVEGDATAQTNSVGYLDQVMQSIACELRKIANELKPARTFISPTQPDQQMKRALTALRRQEIRPGNEEKMQQVLAFCDAVRDQLHIAKKLAKSWKYSRQRLQMHISVPQHTHLRLHDAQAIIRANLTLRSSAFRHAIRLGTALALATALYRIFPLLIQRGYWIPLTALLVLKPDFKTTFARGAARALGTMLGATLTTVLVSILAPTNVILVILAAVMAYMAFSVLFSNYAIFSAFITMETVFLITFVIPQPLITAAYRTIDTAVGSILALLIYALWPTWERSQVPGKIADRLEALRRYLVAVMEVYAITSPSDGALDVYDDLTINSRRMESRLARSNAEASVERSLQEPEPHRTDSSLAPGLLGAADNLSRSVLALDGYLIGNPSRHALPQLTPFTSKVDEALRLLAAAIREDQPVAALPDLQESLHILERAAKADKRAHNESFSDLRLVIPEAKRIVRNINTMNQLLSTKPEQYKREKD